MRILYVVHQFYPEFHTGTERVTLQLARMAQRAGHRVHVLTCALGLPAPDWLPSDSVSETWVGVWDGIPVTAIGRDALPAAVESSFDIDQPRARELEAWMKLERFDVVHVMHTMRVAVAVLAAQRAGIPIVITVTDFFLPCLRVNLMDATGKLCTGPERGRRCGANCATPTWTAAALEARWSQARAILSSARARVAPSQYVATQFLGAFPGLHFHVVPHGVELLRVLHAAPMQRVIRGPGPVLAYVGSVVEAKGLHVLLQAMSRIPNMALCLVVAGHAYGDGYAREIDRLADADPRVQRLGACAPEEVGSLMQSIDLLCVPSLVPESFSLVLHEAAAAGVPALVSDLGAPMEVVSRQGCGDVLPAGDVGAWAQALRDIASDPRKITRWGRSVNLSMRVEEEAFLYESLYRSILTS